MSFKRCGIYSFYHADNKQLKISSLKRFNFPALAFDLLYAAKVGRGVRRRLAAQESPHMAFAETSLTELCRGFVCTGRLVNGRHPELRRSRGEGP